MRLWFDINWWVRRWCIGSFVSRIMLEILLIGLPIVSTLSRTPWRSWRILNMIVHCFWSGQPILQRQLPKTHDVFSKKSNQTQYMYKLHQNGGTMPNTQMYTTSKLRWKHNNYSVRSVRSSKMTNIILRIILVVYTIDFYSICGSRLSSLWLVYGWLTIGFTEDFRPFNPGLETYYTLKYAEEKNVQTIFGGSEFDPITI